jgi:hypothetical protein
MTKQVLNEARRLGFFCQLNDESNWQILPQQPEATWKLTTVDNSRWILSVQNIPQLYLNSEEAIAFLAIQAI